MTHHYRFALPKHLNEEEIALYVDAITLNKQERLPNTLLQHVEECEECKSSIIGVVDIMKDQHIDPATQHPYFVEEQARTAVYPLYYRVAAMFIIAAFIGSLYFVLMNPTMTQTPIISLQHDQTKSSHIQKELSSTKTATELYAANFTTSPNLDDLVRTKFRSSSVEVLSPQIGDIVHAPITFRWKPYEKTLKIRILSNKEITLLTSITQKNIFKTAKVFEPGLYYWKLEDNDELIYTGKFFVK